MLLRVDLLREPGALGRLRGQRRLQRVALPHLFTGVRLPLGDDAVERVAALPLDLATGTWKETFAGKFELVAHGAIRLRRNRRMIGARQATSRASHGLAPMKRRTAGRLTMSRL